MKIRLLESIRLRSEELLVGTEIDVSDSDAQQLIAAGHAEAVPAPAKTTTKTPNTAKE